MVSARPALEGAACGRASPAVSDAVVPALLPVTCRIILGLCVLLAVLLSLLNHAALRTRCLHSIRARHSSWGERWNARLNSWVREHLRVPHAAQPDAGRSLNGGSAKLDSGAPQDSPPDSPQGSPRLDDAQLVAELVRLQRLVERRGAATGGAGAQPC